LMLGATNFKRLLRRNNINTPAATTTITTNQGKASL
jgi:hypothetical protein